jgi:uncharacterized protein YndB with AHSA1/START domain
MTEFRRRGHWRRGRDGQRHWVSEHTVNRTSFSPRRNTPTPRVRPSVRAADGRPTYNASPSIFDFSRPSPDRPADWAKLSRTRNARCPVCGQAVYFYANELGSKVYFDDLGPPWPKHPCTDLRTRGMSGSGGVREPYGSWAPPSSETPATVDEIWISDPAPLSPLHNETDVSTEASSPSANEWTMSFDCSVHELWSAWSSPDALAQWFYPSGSSMPRADISMDLRSGGTLRYTLLDRQAGTQDNLICVFRSVEPGEHVIFKWGPASQKFNLTVAIRVVFIEEPGGGSSLWILVTDLSGYRDFRVLTHWKNTFDNLRSFVELVLPYTIRPGKTQSAFPGHAHAQDRSEMEKGPDSAAETNTPPPVVPPPTDPSQRDESESQSWLARFRRFWTGR